MKEDTTNILVNTPEEGVSWTVSGNVLTLSVDSSDNLDARGPNTVTIEGSAGGDTVSVTFSLELIAAAVPELEAGTIAPPSTATYQIDGVGTAMTIDFDHIVCSTGAVVDLTYTYKIDGNSISDPGYEFISENGGFPTP